jgi:hypothetical protein
MPFWLRWPIRVVQRLVARTIDQSGDMLVKPLFDEKAGGFKLLNYLTSSTPSESAVTSLHSDAAKDFMWKHTNDVINNIVFENKVAC